MIFYPHMIHTLDTLYHTTVLHVHHIEPASPHTHVQLRGRVPLPRRVCRELTATTPRTCVVDLPKVRSLGIFPALIAVTYGSKLPTSFPTTSLSRGGTRWAWTWPQPQLTPCVCVCVCVCVDKGWNGRLCLFSIPEYRVRLSVENALARYVGFFLGDNVWLLRWRAGVLGMCSCLVG
jgi:hypothetical protein